MASVLAIGAHPDDIELGCGGALAQHVASGDCVTMLVVTCGEAGSGPVAERTREQQAAAAVLGVAPEHLRWGGLPDGRVSNHELELVHLIECAIESAHATTIYTHSNLDSHQDHRAVAVATWGAARHCANVLCYDSPSSHAFSPSVFVDITSTLDKKMQALAAHASQVQNSSMASTSLVRTQAGYRGFQARVEAAEGFVPHRMILHI